MSGLGGVRNRAYVHDESSDVDSDAIYSNIGTHTMNNGEISDEASYEI